jgi:hypothetical protein
MDRYPWDREQQTKTSEYDQEPGRWYTAGVSDQIELQSEYERCSLHRALTDTYVRRTSFHSSMQLEPIRVAADCNGESVTSITVSSRSFRCHDI